MAYRDTFQVDGLKTPYIEDGAGPAVILLHGASLIGGSSFSCIWIPDRSIRE